MANRPTWPWRHARVSALLPNRRRAGLALGLLSAGSLVIAAMPLPAAAHENEGSRYVQTNLVSDLPGMAMFQDSSLVNPWGMSFGPTTPVWVSDNGADVTTLYRGATPGVPFAKAPLTVGIPDGAPTGQVFNPTADFVVHNGAASGAALFIFASENGFIDGWSPAVPPPPPSTMAQHAVTVPHAVYKGLAITTGPGGDFLFAANFHSGRIDVFDGMFTLQHWAGAFRDSRIPNGYAPFNIQNLGGKLYVTYAKQDPFKHDDLAGPGRGFVDVFDLHGHLLHRLISRGRLNSPWGLAIAPKGFGSFSGDLLVGNFGDGKINAYNPRNGHFEGTLMMQGDGDRDGDDGPIVIPGLWGLMFGNGTAGTPQTLLFTAGINDEADGLMGTITLAPHSH